MAALTGELFYAYDNEQAVRAFEAANRLEDFETACRLWRQAEAEFIEMGSEHVALAKEHTGRPECAAF